LLGQTCSQAQIEYFKGNLKYAEATLLDVLQLALSRSESAVCWRLLGMIQYSLGKKVLAQNSFERALSFDDQLSIQKKDAIDPTVVTFFLRIKSKQQPNTFSSPTPPPPREPPPTQNSPVPYAAPPYIEPSYPQGAPEPIAPYVTDPVPIESSPPQDFLLDSEPPARRSRKAKKPPKDPPSDFFLKILPLGAGQFLYGRPLMGSFFLVTEAFTLYQIVTIQGKIPVAEDDLNNYINENCQIFAANQEGERQREVCVSYKDEQETYISRLNEQFSLYAGGLAVLLVAGAAESLGHPWFEDSNPGKKKKTRKKKGSFFGRLTPDAVTPYFYGKSSSFSNQGHSYLRITWTID
jgi:hypothetical protein